MFANATDWALKRLFKFLLKRNLKHLLRTEIDLDQLSVELGKGTLELTEVLLNTDYLSTQLAGTGWEVTAGLVGTVRVVVPLAALYSEGMLVEVEDVLLTVRPSSRPASSAEAGGGGPRPDAAAAHGPEDQATAMSDGVKLIAGGIEALLRRMRVQATGVVVRVEVPKLGRGSGWHVMLLRLEGVQYGSSAEEGLAAASGAAAPPAALCLSKRVAFQGLALAIQPGPGAGAALQPNAAAGVLGGLDGGGVSGVVELHLLCGPQQQQQQHPSVAVSVQLETVQLHVHQHQAMAAVEIAAALEAAMQEQRAASAKPASSAVPSAAPAPEQHWGSQSFIQGLMLPDCEGLVVEALTASQQGPAGEEEDAEFFDAQSLIGSLQSLSASAASLSDSALREEYFDPALSQMHDLAASVRQLSTSEPLRWELHTAVSTLGISLFYPTESKALLDFAPRLSLACSQLHLEVKSVSGRFEGGVLSVNHLEVSEQLPLAGSGGDHQAAAQSGAQRGPVQENPKIASVVQLSLSSAASGAYGVPTFAGEYTFSASSLGSPFTSTLDQLSELQSITSSQLYGTMPKDTAVTLPAIRVLPVLCCSSNERRQYSPGASPVLLVMASRSDPATLSLDIATLPVSAWASLSFLERAHALVQPLWEHSQGHHRQLAADYDAQSCEGASAKAEVAAAIQDILFDLRNDPAKRAGGDEAGLRIHVALYVPRLCLVHDIAAASGTGIGGVSFFAAEISMPLASAGVVQDAVSRVQGPIHLADSQPVRERLRDITPMLRIENTYTMSPKLRTSTRGTFDKQTTWDAKLAVSDASLYAVEVRPGGASPSLHASRFFSAAVDTTGEGLTIDADLAPHRLSDASLLENAWAKLQSGLHSPAYPSEEYAGHWESDCLDGGQFREQCIATSLLFIHLRAPAVILDISQSTLAAVIEAADAIVQLTAPQQAAVDLGGVATQVALLAEVSVLCSLTAAENSFSIAAAGAEVFCVSNLAGIQGAGAVIATVGGLDMDMDSSSCLLHRPNASLVEGGSPALEAILLSRPKGGASPVMAGGRYIIPTQTVAAVSLSGCTFGMEPGDASMSWVPKLGAIFKRPSSTYDDDAAALCSTDWAVNLNSIAISYEPKLASPTDIDSAVRAVLLLGGVSWRMMEGAPLQQLTLRCLSLHLAEASLWDPARRRGVTRRDLAGTELSAAAFKRIAVESEISFGLPAVDARGGDGCWLGEIQNHLLSIVIDPEGLGLLSRMATQLGASQMPPPSEPCPQKEERGRVQDMASSIFIDGAWCDEAFDESPTGSPPTLVEDFFNAIPDSPAASFDFQVVGLNDGREREVDESRGTWYPLDDPALPRPLQFLDEYVATPPAELERAPRVGRRALGDLPEMYPAPSNRLTARDVNIEVRLVGFDPRSAAGEVHIKLDRACLQVDWFSLEDAYRRRLAFSIDDIIVRDNLQQLEEGRAKQDGARGNGWRRTLGYNFSARVARDTGASFLHLVIDSVQPGDAAGAPEYRAHLVLLPLRLQLDQHSVVFLQRLKQQFESLAEPVLPDSGSSGALFMQYMEIEPFAVTVDYTPASVDLAALREGNLLEAINILPWGTVQLSFRHLRLIGLEGMAAIATAAVSAWVDDIARYQISAFLRGIAPIKSMFRLGTAAAQIASIPVDAYLRGISPSDADMRRRLIRSIMQLVKAVVVEALGLSAAVVKGAQAAVGSAPAAEATVGAVRGALRNARDALDPERLAERRLNA